MTVKIKTGKPEIHRLDIDFIMEMAKIMTQSALSGKYPDINGMPSWRVKINDFSYTDLSNALFRHFYGACSNNPIDSESGSSHLAHIAVNAMMLYYKERYKRNIAYEEKTECKRKEDDDHRGN